MLAALTKSVTELLLFQVIALAWRTSSANFSKPERDCASISLYCCMFVPLRPRNRKEEITAARIRVDRAMLSKTSTKVNPSCRVDRLFLRMGDGVVIVIKSVFGVDGTEGSGVGNA